MAIQSFTRNCLIACLLASTHTAFADDLLKQPFTIETDKEVVVAIKPDPGPIEKETRSFTYEWNRYQPTVAVNQRQVAKSEAFLNTIKDVSKLPNTERLWLGLMFYKLGTYYTQAVHQPDLAIPRLLIADALLTHPLDKAWVNNQLAYAYSQKYMLSNLPADKIKALNYANKVTSESHPQNPSQTAAIAFAYMTEGMTFNVAKAYPQAIASYQKALSRFQTEQNDQKAITQTRLAEALLIQTGHDQEAIRLLMQAKQHWARQATQQRQLPEAADNLILLGQAHLKVGKAKTARDELMNAIEIYKSLYGNQSNLLVKPYQLLSTAYKDLGNMDQATAYEQKAHAVDHA